MILFENIKNFLQFNSFPTYSNPANTFKVSSDYIRSELQSIFPLNGFD